MRGKVLMRFGLKAGFVLATLVVGSMPGTAFSAEQPKFEFLSPSHEESVRIYRLNTSTGEIGACYYGPPGDGTGIGTTECYSAGEGSGSPGPGNYRLKRSSNIEDTSVFRVNIDSGEVSICFVQSGKVLCTQQAR
ncbi:MAG: hypothetical protein AAF495_07000 [Pseudomonadota bacterium]